MSDNQITVSALWLRKQDGKAQMLAEVGGIWKLAWEETLDGGPFSAICEARGADRWKADRL